jgi:biotin carboxyl carrier protein
MNDITREDVFELLEILRGSTIEALRLEMNSLKLQISKHGTSKIGKECIAAISEERFLPVKAPMLGFFRSCPKQGAHVFVETEQVVNKNDTLCIIDVLGQPNPIKAGVEGCIKKIYVADGEFVEFNQTLFLIEKKTTTGEAA